jgi:hypothetical protein
MTPCQTLSHSPTFVHGRPKHLALVATLVVALLEITASVGTARNVAANGVEPAPEALSNTLVIGQLKSIVPCVARRTTRPGVTYTAALVVVVMARLAVVASEEVDGGQRGVLVVGQRGGHGDGGHGNEDESRELHVED